MCMHKAREECLVMCIHTYIHTRLDMCTDRSMDMCTVMCWVMRLGVFIYVHRDMQMNVASPFGGDGGGKILCADLQDRCADMRTDLCMLVLLEHWDGTCG